MKTKNVNLYKWLSIIGFGLLYQKLFIIVHYKKKDINLYLKLFGKSALIFILYIIIPIIGLMLIMSLLESYNVIYLIVNFITLIYVYIGGVIAVASLFNWAKRNNII